MFDAAFPDVLFEHGHAVEDHNSAEGRIETGVEEGGETRTDGGPRLRPARARRSRADIASACTTSYTGAKQRVLATEVVVEGPSGHSRGCTMPSIDVPAYPRSVNSPQGDPDQQLPCGVRLTLPQGLDSHKSAEIYRLTLRSVTDRRSVEKKTRMKTAAEVTDGQENGT